MPWEVFENKRYARVAAISVDKSGRILWGKATHLLLGSPDHIELYLDRERKLLGLKKADASRYNFRVHKSMLQNTWTVSAKGPLNAVGLLPPETIRGFAIQEPESDIVYIKLEGLEVLKYYDELAKAGI